MSYLVTNLLSHLKRWNRVNASIFIPNIRKIGDPSWAGNLKIWIWSWWKYYRILKIYPYRYHHPSFFPRVLLDYMSISTTKIMLCLTFIRGYFQLWYSVFIIMLKWLNAQNENYSVKFLYECMYVFACVKIYRRTYPYLIIEIFKKLPILYWNKFTSIDFATAAAVTLKKWITKKLAFTH